MMGHARHTVSWALGLSLAACVFCVVASFILGVHNPCIPVETTPGVGGYTDPETGAVFPVIDATNQEVYYITSQPTPGGPGFQPMSSVFQPPPYESVAAPPPSLNTPLNSTTDRKRLGIQMYKNNLWARGSGWSELMSRVKVEVAVLSSPSATLKIWWEGEMGGGGWGGVLRNHFLRRKSKKRRVIPPKVLFHFPNYVVCCEVQFSSSLCCCCFVAVVAFFVCFFVSLFVCLLLFSCCFCFELS